MKRGHRLGRHRRCRHEKNDLEDYKLDIFWLLQQEHNGRMIDVDDLPEELTCHCDLVPY